MQRFIHELVRHFFEHKRTWLVPVALVLLLLLVLVLLAPELGVLPFLFRAH